MVEKGEYTFPKEQLFLKEKMSKERAYSFSDLLGILKEEYPDVKGSRVNKWLENLELDGDIVKVIDSEKGILFRTTKGLKKAVGIVEWQARGHALLYVTDEKQNKTGETIFLPKNEAALVINGEFVRVKRIPSIWKGKESTEDEGLVVDVLSTKPHPTIARVVENTKKEWHGSVKVLESMLTRTVKMSERYQENMDEIEAKKINTEGAFISGSIRRSGSFERWAGLRAYFDPIKKIGELNDSDIETKLALEWMRVKEGFSKKALEESIKVSEISSEILLKDKGRKDLRLLNFVTIDGATTKDFDDALYAEKNENGYKLFVAISDVSRYVESYGFLDNEAKQKGSSYYMPHRVVPMLPEILSQGVCSLNPFVDRAVVILEVNIDNNGLLLDKDFYPALIKSHGRLTYNEVDYLYNTLEKENQSLGNPNENSSVNMIPLMINVDSWNNKFKETLTNLFKVTSLLNKERNPIPFERDPEINYHLNEQGKIKYLYIEEDMTPANKLVEECMLLANRSAAKILSEHGSKSVLFRNQLAPEEGQGFLRAARYENNNLGHYALGHEHYMHFTSPIRRYPDLMAHRELKNILGYSNYLVPDENETNNIGLACTELQRLAKGGRIKADNWLIAQFADNMKKEPEKAIIIRENEKGWIVQGEKTNLQGYVSKPRDKAEEEAVLKSGLYFEVDRVDFYAEKVFLRAKAPILNFENEVNEPEKEIEKKTFKI